MPTQPPSSPVTYPRTLGDVFDELAPIVTGAVSGLCMMPGFFLCAPGILFLVVTPLVLVLLLAGAALAVGLIVVAPVLVLVRVARRFRHMDAATMPAAAVLQIGPTARR